MVNGEDRLVKMSDTVGFILVHECCQPTSLAVGQTPFKGFGVTRETQLEYNVF